MLRATSLGNGRYRAGSVELDFPTGAAHAIAAGVAVRIYLRPEDRHVEGDIAALPNRISGKITAIDYLGTFCLAELSSPELGQPIMISYSLNQLHDLDVRTGNDVDIALRVDRVRVFSDRAVA